MTFGDTVDTIFGTMQWYLEVNNRRTLDVAGRVVTWDYCAEIMFYADSAPEVIIFPPEQRFGDRRTRMDGENVYMNKDATTEEILDRVMLELCRVGIIDPLRWVAQ